MDYKNKFSPIIIKTHTNIRFIILGPIDEYDGVLVRSEKTDMSLMKFSNRVYYKSLNEEGYLMQQKHFNINNGSYHWSSPMAHEFDISNLQFERRQFRLLICWKVTGTTPADYDKDKVRTHFGQLATLIFKIVNDKKLSIEAKENNITWYLSEVL